jgi:SpoVK/Ycf46/Vps4 family AAA+-type ATPase
MAGKDLKDLIAAYGRRDDLLFRRAAQALISEEEAKRHTTLARELSRLLASSSSITMFDGPELTEPPVDRETSAPLATVRRPERRLDALVLSDSVTRTFEEFIAEVRHWPELDSLGLPRRNRLLLYGPPGCGKTSAVEALATSLGRPLVTARVDALMSSYLGETASNLRKLFEYADTDAFVVFLDEFDSLGKLRDDASDHGELRRVVNAVLQLIDSYAGPSIIVAATNHPEILDAALWRRFDLVEELPLPNTEEIRRVLVHVLRGRVGLEGLHEMAAALVGLPHAAAEFAGHAALRRAVMSGLREVPPGILKLAVADTVARRWV